MFDVFIKILNMSLSASVLIAVVIVLRFLLRGAPRYTRCFMWALVGIRLVCPVSVKSALSLMPRTARISSEAIQFGQIGLTPSGGMSASDAVTTVVHNNSAASVEPVYVLARLFMALWLAGAAVMLAYTLVTWVRLRLRVRPSVQIENNVYICDEIDTPFILGLLRPRIYLPSALSAVQKENVLMHERAHLRRLDHIWKPLGFAVLTLHWFNPLVWAAYILMCRDLELACDEKVISRMTAPEKKSYSETLLACSVRRSGLAACPLAFGEVGVKERVKTVLRYKKPSVMAIALALVICAVTAGCFMTDPQEPAAPADSAAPTETAGLAESPAPDDVTAPADMLSLAIQDAIMEHNASGYNDYDYACCSYIPLGTNESDDGRRITCYGWAYYGEYNVSGAGIEDVSGSHVPVALTFLLGSGDITLEEYWTPGDGDRYEQSIREKFPEDIAGDALDSQKYVLAQVQSCYAQVVADSGLDTAPVIASLLERICSAQAESSPYALVENSPIEYRELLYYGQYTVDYCMERFAAGGETGAEGYVMAMACSELLQVPLDGAETGQDWYDGYISSQS